MRKAIIAGATGLVGSELLKILVNSNHYQKVHVITRRSVDIVHPKIVTHITDFESLDRIAIEETIDDAYCTMGTTIKKAGSRDAFRKVDFQYIVSFAEKAKDLGVSNFAAISSMGAGPSSTFFYNRVKGETEEALKNIVFKHLLLIRPSLLLGDRKEKRFGESVAEMLMKVFDFIIPAKYKAVHVEKVATKMYHSVLEDSRGINVIESDQIGK